MAPVLSRPGFMFAETFVRFLFLLFHNIFFRYKLRFFFFQKTPFFYVCKLTQFAPKFRKRMRKTFRPGLSDIFYLSESYLFNFLKKISVLKTRTVFREKIPRTPVHCFQISASNREKNFSSVFYRNNSMVYCQALTVGSGHEKKT